MSEIGSILRLARFLLAITVLMFVAAVKFAVLATQPSDVKEEVLRLQAELRAIKVTIDENAKQLGENKENLAELRRRFNDP